MLEKKEDVRNHLAARGGGFFLSLPLTHPRLPAWLGEITGRGVLQTGHTRLLALSLRGDSQSPGVVTARE